MSRRHLHTLDIVYLGAALTAALLVQRADLRRPLPDGAIPVSVLQRATPEPEESFRLAPDRRVLIAVGDLHRLITGASACEAEAHFDGARWHVACDGVEVGTLSETPDYPELVGLLQAWAVRLGVDSLVNAPGITGDPAPLEAELREFHALRAADLAERRWSVGERGMVLFELGVRSLVHLVLESTDRVEASDPLAARALALLAACQALDPAALEGESCLLAERMGYGAHARAAARRRSPYDPVRAFVCGNDARLAALASQRRATPEARLLQLARTRGVEAEVPAPLTVLVAAEHDLTGIGALAAPDTARGVTSTTGEEASLASLVNEFERLMGVARPAAGGLFIDRDVLGGYWRGRFYSALRAAVEPPPGTPSPEPGARAVADPLAGVHTGAGVEFAAWARHVAAGGATPTSRSALIADLGALPHFGAPLLCDAFDALCGGSPSPEPGIRRAAQRLAARLDTRPAHRARFGRLAYRNLLALPLAEDLLESAASAGAPMDCELEAWWGEHTGDRPRLESMLDRPGLTWAQEAAILDHYEALPALDSAAVCRAYRRCIAGHPGSWRLLAGYTGYLERQRAWVPARTSIHQWLERNADRAGIDAIEARATLARLYEDQGRYAEGFAAVASVVASQQPSAMAGAVRLLEALGRSSQAETLAVFAAERASEPGAAQAQAAELFWRHGKPGAAARLLAARAPGVTTDDWRHALGAGFARCFGDRVAAGRSATDSLLATGRIPAEAVSQLAAAAADSGAWELAFEVESRLHHAPARRIEQLVSLYRSLERWRSEDEAARWLGPRLRGASAAGLAQIERLAFTSQEDRLLWSVCSDSTGPGAEYPWLLRAAAALRRGDHGGEHARELAWHFAAPDSGHDRTLGRFLLGLEDESRIASLARIPSEACEAFYFLGFKAQAEGRTRDAAAWFTRCLGTHQNVRAEYRWAYDQLLAWRRLGLSLSRTPDRPQRPPA